MSQSHSARAVNDIGWDVVKCYTSFETSAVCKACGCRIAVLSRDPDFWATEGIVIQDHMLTPTPEPHLNCVRAWRFLTIKEER